jgi:hypothetical protein
VSLHILEPYSNSIPYDNHSIYTIPKRNLQILYDRVKGKHQKNII